MEVPMRNESKVDTYSFDAELYDHVVPYRERQDVAFFVGAASEAGSPVLEVGCGTGRILIPTARPACTSLAWICQHTCWRCAGKNCWVNLHRSNPGFSWCRRISALLSCPILPAGDNPVPAVSAFDHRGGPAGLPGLHLPPPGSRRHADPGPLQPFPAVPDEGQCRRGIWR